MEAGPIRETLKTFTGRVHTQGATRGGKPGTNIRGPGEGERAGGRGTTALEAERELHPGDYHLVLHYYDKGVTPGASRRGQEGIPAAAAEGVPEAGRRLEVCRHAQRPSG